MQSLPEVTLNPDYASSNMHHIKSSCRYSNNTSRLERASDDIRERASIRDTHSELQVDKESDEGILPQEILPAGQVDLE
jgi:hypothetical protein